MSKEGLSNTDSFCAKFVFEGHGIRNVTYEDKVSDIVSEMEELFIRGGRNIVLLEFATDNSKSYSEWISQIHGSTSSWELAYVLHRVYPFLSERFGPNWPSRFKPAELIDMANQWKGEIISSNTGHLAYRLACYKAVDLMTAKGFSVEIHYEKGTLGAYDDSFSEYKHYADINQLKESHRRMIKSTNNRNSTIVNQVEDLFTASSRSNKPVRLCIFLGTAHNNLFTMLTPRLLEVSSGKSEALLRDDGYSMIDRLVLRNVAGLQVTDEEWWNINKKLEHPDK